MTDLQGLYIQARVMGIWNLPLTLLCQMNRTKPALMHNSLDKRLSVGIRLLVLGTCSDLFWDNDHPRQIIKEFPK